MAPVDKAGVVLVAMSAFLHERPGAREWPGIALVGAGLLVPGSRRWAVLSAPALATAAARH